MTNQNNQDHNDRNHQQNKPNQGQYGDQQKMGSHQGTNTPGHQAADRDSHKHGQSHSPR